MLAKFKFCKIYNYYSTFLFLQRTPQIHLRFGSGAECRWSPCFSLRYECRTEPNYAEEENRRQHSVLHELGRKQTQAVNVQHTAGMEV